MALTFDHLAAVLFGSVRRSLVGGTESIWDATEDSAYFLYRLCFLVCGDMNNLLLLTPWILMNPSLQPFAISSSLPCCIVPSNCEPNKPIFKGCCSLSGDGCLWCFAARYPFTWKCLGFSLDKSSSYSSAMWLLLQMYLTRANERLSGRVWKNLTSRLRMGYLIYHLL